MAHVSIPYNAGASRKMRNLTPAEKVYQCRQILEKCIEEDGFIEPEMGLLALEKVIFDGKESWLVASELEEDLDSQLDYINPTPNYCPTCDQFYSDGDKEDGGKCGCYHGGKA